MKYAAFVYRESANLGDYIQSLAAVQFLPKIDLYLDLNYLNEYQDQETVKMIFNGWFMHQPNHWPPPATIHPLFISFHISNFNRSEAVLAHPEMAFYYKQFAPVGCRDYHTVELLRKIGVPTYFSGDIALTLPRRKGPRSEEIVFVDPLGREKDGAFYFPGDKKFRRKFWESIAPKEVLDKAIYVTHYDLHKEDHLARYHRAEELLQLYSRAKFVVTSRLHCALPCLAFGTPVLYIESGFSSGPRRETRYKGLLELMRSTTLKDLIKGKPEIDWDSPPKNPVDTSPLASSLRKTCLEFSQC